MEPQLLYPMPKGRVFPGPSHVRCGAAHPSSPILVDLSWAGVTRSRPAGFLRGASETPHPSGPGRRLAANRRGRPALPHAPLAARGTSSNCSSSVDPLSARVDDCPPEMTSETRSK